MSQSPARSAQEWGDLVRAAKSAKNAKAQSTNRVLEKPLHQPNGKLAKGHVKLGGMQAGTPV